MTDPDEPVRAVVTRTGRFTYRYELYSKYGETLYHFIGGIEGLVKTDTNYARGPRWLVDRKIRRQLRRYDRKQAWTEQVHRIAEVPE